MSTSKAAPFVFLVSTALGGCASDSSDGQEPNLSDGQETNLTGGVASTGGTVSPGSGDFSSDATAGSAAGDDSPPGGVPASVGSGTSDGLAGNGGESEGSMAGDQPASSDATPGGAGSESMEGEGMSGESMGSLDDDSTSSGETGGDEGSSTGDSFETDVGGDGNLPTPDEGAPTDGDPSVGDEPDMGGGDEDPAGDEPITYATCPDENWNLVWSDEFDGPAGSAVDGSKWNYDSGPNWYNGELQYYASGTDNASLDGNGNLVIEARREDREGRQYTSARLKTEGKHTFTYGRFEGRMKLPYGQGMWPALWMLGGTRWPDDGEIDIMENLGREPSIAHGTIHGPGYSGANGPGASFTLPDGEVFSDDFHIFAVEWEPEVIRWYIDGEHYSTKTPADIGGNRWVFDHPFFFLVNLAVGGEWPGNPDETTVFPQQFLIDYVRVCQQ